MEHITALGHCDKFVICDIGLPIPKGAEKIDLALIRGIPSFMQVLKVVLNEVVVEEAVLMDEIKTYNQNLDQSIHKIVTRQRIGYKRFEDFLIACEKAKFFIRTGEAAACSNIILTSASGVEENVALYNINL